MWALCVGLIDKINQVLFTILLVILALNRTSLIAELIDYRFNNKIVSRLTAVVKDLRRTEQNIHLEMDHVSSRFTSSYTTLYQPIQYNWFLFMSYVGSLALFYQTPYSWSVQRTASTVIHTTGFNVFWYLIEKCWTRLNKREKRCQHPWSEQETDFFVLVIGRTGPPISRKPAPSAGCEGIIGWSETHAANRPRLGSLYLPCFRRENRSRLAQIPSRCMSRLVIRSDRFTHGGETKNDSPPWLEIKRLMVHVLTQIYWMSFLLTHT